MGARARRLPWRRAPARRRRPGAAALRGQLQDPAVRRHRPGRPATTWRPSSAGSSSRAAEAVLAPAYLLAVEAPGGGAPLVHSAACPTTQVPALAAALLAGSDLGTAAPSSATSRPPGASHGRLAALYRPGDQPMGDEAVDAGRLRRPRRRRARPAHRARGDPAARPAAPAPCSRWPTSSPPPTDADAISAVVAEALPRVVGCSSASVMLWDPGPRPAAGPVAGQPDGGARGIFLRHAAPPGGHPRADGAAHRPRAADHPGRRQQPGAARACWPQLGIADVVALPLVAGGAFLGVATASWPSGQVPAELTGDVLARLRGVGDQAVSALQRARLLETVRHQAPTTP